MDKPPDFAMSRAVEILAQIYERQRRASEVPPPPLDRVAQLFNETMAFDVTKTTRAQVERALGVAFSYPVRGWHTYCVSGGDLGREFVSLFYQSPGLAEDPLVSAEVYLPKAKAAPALAPRNLGRVRLIPGEIAIGTQIGSLPESFARVEKPEGLGPYDAILQAQFPGGVAYAMGSSNVVERLAIYALRA
ncbi:MAG: hypothetical protein JOY98_07780 [Candidatus Eremiobacteraeota bacterium]|nr:hypothetical protein [Candidatus Eremiobacteraeota bacterium]